MNNNEDNLDYWFEYKKYICFPKTSDSCIRIGNFILYTKIINDWCHFYYCYDGQEKELINAFNDVVKKRTNNNNTWINNKPCLNLNGKKFILYTTFDILKEPKYYYYKDFIRHLEYMFSGTFFLSKKKEISKEFTEFCKLLNLNAKKFSNIREKKFKEIFGKTIEEYKIEKEKEAEIEKDVIYSILVSEAYSSLQRLRDECDIIMKGLQNGREGYDLERYLSFRKQILQYNKRLGLKNEFTKQKIKKGNLRNQTLMIFLRDNAKKPIKK